MPHYTSLKLPELSLVLLIGTSGAGKSTFARRLFQATEIVSSDQCRALVADDENDQSLRRMPLPYYTIWWGCVLSGAS
nr:AAA family ATPase [Hymenobacter sp. AT01-02]